MTDKELIYNLGGTTAVAKILKIKPQNVNNWVKRGIPAKIKLQYPKLFLTKKSKRIKELEP